MKTRTVGTGLLMACVLWVFSSCEDSPEFKKGGVDFVITDAPSDDASIKGVFVTVADVQVNGVSVSGFARQTIDLKEYYEGKTRLLKSTEMQARTYSGLTLVLDLDQDEFGNSPGCYVLNTDDAKFTLGSAGKVSINVAGDWTIAPGAINTIVLDVDLRKGIRSSGGGYQFVSAGNLASAVRIVSKNSSATISGTYSEQSTVDADKVIVYAYKKGTFIAATETTANGDGVLFSNAVASAEVRDGFLTSEFTIAFLEEGDYELHFVAYDKPVSGDRFNYQAMLSADVSFNGSVREYFELEGGASIAVTAVGTGPM